MWIHTSAGAANQQGGPAFTGDREAEIEAWHRRHARYPPFRRTLSLEEFAAKFQHLENGSRATEVVELVAGRVTAKRLGSKSTAFIDIEEGCTASTAGSDAWKPLEDGQASGAGGVQGTSVQVLAIRGRYTGSDACGDGYSPEEEFAEVTSLLRRGDILGVQGFPGKSKKGELSIIPTSLTLLAPCLPNLPLPSHKLASEGEDVELTLRDPEVRFRQRHVDLLVNKQTRKTFITRSRTISALRRFLEARGFLEVETPLLNPSAGGALARPFLTRSWAWGTNLALRIAPELFLKRLVIGGLDRVFEIGKVFRNEGVTPRHNPEFTSCEFYEAYADLESLISTTEEMLHSIVTEVAGSPRVPVQLGKGDGDEEAVEVDFTPPFRRIWIVPALEERLGCRLPDINDPTTVEELRAIVDKAGILDTLPQPHTPARLMDHLIGEFLEPECVQPTFLCGHPVVMSPLAKATPDDPGTSARFELFVAGVELANAYSELNDPAEQRSRFASQAASASAGDAEAHVVDEPYCRALEVGLPPTGGWGMGVDRLVTLLTRTKHIREVLLFPIMKPSDASATPGAGKDTQ